MNDQEIIRKAVELADGFDAEDCFEEFCWTGEDVYAEEDRHYLDALAAQLVRQVDALYETGRFFVDSDRWMVRVEKHSIGTMGHSEGPDRTMNTLKAIVESKVLEEGK